MSDRTKAILLTAIFVIGLLASPFVFRALAADKPEDFPWCAGSSEGYCNPVDDPARAIPPDLPPAARLRLQIIKERKAHRAEVRLLRTEISRLGGGR